MDKLLQDSLLVGILASVACGVVGSYVVARRITYIAGGIAHCVLGGIGAAHYLKVVYGWEFLDPLYGASAAALLAAMVIGVVSLKAKEREDTAISAIWSVGMATGVLFVYGAPGYSPDLTSMLFGSIVVVGAKDLILVGILDVIVLGAAIIFYNHFVAVCFDEEFAKLRNVRTNFYYLLLLALTALTVVLLLNVVGIILVIALLTLPSAIAGHFSRTLWQMMVLGALICMAFTTAGILMTAESRIPAGAMIVVLAGAAYLLVTVGRAVARRYVKRRLADIIVSQVRKPAHRHECEN